MSDIGNSKVECMADSFMLNFEQAAAAGCARNSPEFVLLSAILKELRGLRADIKDHHDHVTAGGSGLLVEIVR